MEVRLDILASLVVIVFGILALFCLTETFFYVFLRSLLHGRWKLSGNYQGCIGKYVHTLGD